MNNLTKSNYECWMNNDNTILSFHYVTNFLHKTFASYKEFFSFVLKNTQNGCKVQ
jgi:hypothetical protein